MAGLRWARLFAAGVAACTALSVHGGSARADDSWLQSAFASQSSATPTPGAIAPARPGREPATAGKAASHRPPEPPKALIGNHFAPAGGGRWQWRVTRYAWTAADDDAYGEFIRAIGESACKTTHECLASAASNPAFHASNPPGLHFFADCADLPFVLRGYFAWKRGLPFSFSSALSPHPGYRAVKSGLNSFQVIGRYHVVPPGPDPRQALSEIQRVSTAHFRIPLAYKGNMLADHYPVAISRVSIKPGTVIFDALGHIAIVYKVTDDGLIHFIDAHPDNSLTRGVYGTEIERAGPETGAGFVRWRPQTLVGAKKGKDGSLHGGMVVLTRDQQLSDWSDEQYYGTGPGRSRDWTKARYYVDGDEVDYQAYIRLNLAPKGYRFDPIRETRQRIGVLCEELKQRVDAVDAAIKAGIHRRPQPPRLPLNIYVTQGDWETYSTPSRDAQLKTLFKGLREDIERFIAMQATASKHISYDGSDLRADLRRAHDSEAEACTITYTKSDGRPHALTFDEIKQRLFKMSFDPHHCAERRWGATSPDELRSCPDDRVKQAWYDAQQRLRNQIARTIGDRMDFTLDDLLRQAREHSDVGDDEPPAIEVATLLTAR